jgi:hypothetical protein
MEGLKSLKNNIEKLERLTTRERLGELLVRCGVVSFSKLLDLMTEHRQSTYVPFGEFLVDKSYISRQNLIDFLNMQKNQDRVIDSCLQELGLMTNEKKWEKLIRHDKIGELLIRQGKINLSQLIEAIHEQENVSPEMLLGDILVEKAFITPSEFKIALETQQKQIQVISKSIQELTNVTQLPIRVKLRSINTLWQM